jgi:CxxC-x17-CxxC domain-containing protein
MREFSRPSFGGGRDSGRRDGGRREGGRPQMHRATCSECGDSCEVPFRPTGDKPVFCSNCFAGKDGGDRGSRDFGRRESNRSSYGREEKPMFKGVCDECGAPCEVPFRPTAGKPLYCNNCFGKGDNNPKAAAKVSSYDEQFRILNEKIDKIFIALNISEAKKEVIKEVKKVAEVKEIKEKKLAKVVKKVAAKKVLVKKVVVKESPAKKVAKKK